MNKLLLAITLFSASQISYGANHLEKKVKELSAPDDRPCLFFTLEGVNVADSTINQSHWFALPINHHGYREIFSMLLAAKMAGKNISVYTTGEAVCNYAEVSTVKLFQTE